MHAEKKRKQLKMELTKACRYGNVDECRRLQEGSFPADGELSNLHWLLLGTNTSDEDCLAIMEILGSKHVNHRANNVAISGLSRIAKVSSVYPLHLAVLYKGVSVVNRLLLMSANPNLPDSNGETCLMYACREGFSGKVSVLLEHGADSTIVSAINDSVMSLCQIPEIRGLIQKNLDERLLASLDQPEHVSQLLHSNANPNIVCADGETALSSVIKNGGDYETVRLFLECGCVGAPFYMHEILGSQSIPADETIQLLSELIYMKADVEAKDLNGRSCLDLAGGSEKIVRFLVENGAKPKSPKLVVFAHAPTIATSPGNSAPATPLEPTSGTSVLPQFLQSEAAFYDEIVDLSELATRAGSLISELEKSNRFVNRIRDTCVEAKADPPISNQTLLTMQSELNEKLVKLDKEFLSLKSSSSLANFRSIGHFMEVQKKIAQTRRDLVDLNQRLSTPFLTPEQGPSFIPVASPAESLAGMYPDAPASWFRSPDSIEADLENCIRIIRKSANNIVNADSAIFDFINSGGGVYHCQSLQILKLLRNRGSDVNYSVEGITGLMLVCDSDPHEGQIELVDFMLSNSANPNAQEFQRKWTPLIFAINRKNENVCKRLIQKGAQFNETDKLGKLPIDYCDPVIRTLLTT